jgi:hypothetical protein
MAKYLKVGSVLRSKDNPKNYYIKMDQDVSLKKGETLSLQSKEEQLERLESSLSSGKLTEDLAVKIRERLEKIPEWVKYEIQVKRD